jgi:hypothetical protein
MFISYSLCLRSQIRKQRHATSSYALIIIAEIVCGLGGRMIVV